MQAYLLAAFCLLLGVALGYLFRGSASPAAATPIAQAREPRPQPSAADVQAAVAQNAAPRLEVIQASVGNVVHMVPIDDVIYFESADKYVRVITAEREHLIRTSLRELLPQLDPQVFWQVHRGLVVRARVIASALRDESGKVFLTLRGRPERLTASRLYAHLFKGM